MNMSVKQLRKEKEYLIDSSGIKISYRITYGKKTAMVFLHGLGGSLLVWDGIIPFFITKGYTTVAIDLRGHGKSDKPKELDDYSIKAHVKDVVNVLRNENISSCILVGHCLGSIIALEMAKKHLSYIKSMILIAPALRPWYVDTPFFQLIISKVFPTLINSMSVSEQKRQNFYEYLPHINDFDVQRIYRDIHYMSFRSYLANVYQGFIWRENSILQSFDIPTTIIAGKRDKLFSLDETKRVVRTMKNSSLKVIPDGGHVLIFQKPYNLIYYIYRHINKYQSE